MKINDRQKGRWTEADVVMELCHRLKLDRIAVRCEVCVPSHVHRSKWMRCDVAIMDGDEIIALIEVKDRSKPRDENVFSPQQIAYGYATDELKIPVFYCWGMACIETTRAAIGQIWAGRSNCIEIASAAR